MIDQILETLIKAGNVIYFILLISIYAWFIIIKKHLFIKKEVSGDNLFFNTIINYIINSI